MISLFIFTALLIIIYYKLNKRIKKLEDFIVDIYKGHHEHVLISNRDEDNSSKISTFFRDKQPDRQEKYCAFTTKERKAAGLVTRGKAGKLNDK